MVEGPLQRYRTYQIIQNIKDKRAYVYDAGNTLVTTLDSIPEAKLYIMKLQCMDPIASISHEGVKIAYYEYYGKLYIVSCLESVLKDHPNLLNYEYEALQYKRIDKYFHNEVGPANMCVDDGSSLYYWHGKHLSKVKWDKAVFDKKFSKKFDSWLNEEDGV